MSSVSDIIRIPFGYVLEWLYQLTSSYGLALLLFGVIVKLILLPASMKSKKSMMKMSRLAPQMKALEEKYANDKQKYQMEVMKLQQQEGISATGGCLWGFIPLLILLPLYTVIREPLTYMMHLTAEQVQTILEIVEAGGVDLGKQEFYRQLIAAPYVGQFLPQIREALPELANAALTPIDFSFLGVNLGMVPTWQFWTLAGWAQIGLFLIPVVSAASQWFSMWLMQKLNASVTVNEKGERENTVSSATASTNKTMNIMMPAMSLFIGYSMPAGMSIYWISQALVSVVQEFFLTKHYRKVYDAEDEIRRQRAAEEAAKEAERERVRAERRAKLGDVADPNTSKKKIAAKEKAAKGPVVEGKLTPEEREALKNAQPDENKCPSGIADRPYCRGRSYKPVRYGRDTSGPGGYDLDDELRALADAEAEPDEDLDPDELPETEQDAEVQTADAEISEEDETTTEE